MDFWRLWTHWCVAFASIYTVCTLCDVTTLCIAQQDIWWQSLPTTAECEFWVWWVNIGSCHGLLNIVRLRPALQNTTWLQTREQGTKSEKHWTLQGPTHCGCVHTHTTDQRPPMNAYCHAQYSVAYPLCKESALHLHDHKTHGLHHSTVSLQTKVF